MRQNIAKLFNIQGYLIDGMDWQGKRMLLIRVRSPRTIASCQRCGTRSKRIHQYHTRQVLHGLFGEKRVFLRVTKRRFMCRICDKPFTEQLPAIPRYQRRDRHADEQLLSTLSDRSFTAVARERKQATDTVIRHCRETLRTQPIRWPTRGEIRLGIDGHSVKQKRSARTVMELRTHRVLTVLPSEKKAPFEAFLREIPQEIANRIVEVCMDMEAGDATSVQAILPHAKVVSDHFHVIQMANRTLDIVRRIAQDPKYPIPKKLWMKNKEHLDHGEVERIAAYGDHYPELFRLWVLKEDLRQMYEMHSKRVAAYRLNKIIAEYKKCRSGYAWAFAKTLERWHDEILNFFDRRTTNAAVEGMHRKFKLIQRISYGFKTTEHYLMKVTLACVPLYLLMHHTIYN